MQNANATITHDDEIAMSDFEFFATFGSPSAAVRRFEQDADLRIDLTTIAARGAVTRIGG